MPKKYLLELNGCAELLGPYETIPQAKLNAEALAREHGEPMRAVIWDCRPATKKDWFLFDATETDLTKQNWFDDVWVPENIAEKFNTEPQSSPAAPPDAQGKI
jgi:hypothetical protein